MMAERRVVPDTDDGTAVQRELTVFARRVRAQSARLHPELPFVACSLLSHVRATGTCRAVDLAALYRLDKSTVSRQVADLVRQGLVEQVPDPEGHRGKLLRVTAAGDRLLDGATERQRAELDRRLAGWSPAEVAELARLLRRYNGD
jgi:DNA-binding MarR family transcriptional regulator